MKKKIVYVVGGLLSPNGMSQVLSQKINYLAEHTDYELYMILTEKAGTKWYYDISSKVKYVNFDINFDELDTMPLLKKIWYFQKKQRSYKRILTDYLMEIQPDITVSTCRREINFINDIKDGSRKIGEIHFNKNIYRKFNKRYFPHCINKIISALWIQSFIKNVKKLDRFIVLSKEDKVEWKGFSNIIVIYNPVKNLPTSYSTCTNKRAIAVGRYTYQKGFDLLIKAWKIVEQKHPDWELNIYGSGDYNKYQEYANNLKIKTVVCHPAIKDIYKQYIDSSIFILSSRYEGFGLVLAEAMSCGTPVVSFACPCGPLDIINNGIDGLLAKKEDTNDLANKICILIENEDKRISMGKNARKDALRFNEDTIMKQWIDLFNSIN